MLKSKNIFLGFLTAMRQEVTRAHKGWALDSVTLHNEVVKAFKEDITAAPPVSCYVVVIGYVQCNLSKPDLV